MDNNEINEKELEQEIFNSDSDRLEAIIVELREINERQYEKEEKKQKYRRLKLFYNAFKDVVILLACIMLTIVLFINL
ncbi:MAG: hypothetical protein RR416_06150 [Clostridia bacterium]